MICSNCGAGSQAMVNVCRLCGHSQSEKVTRRQLSKVNQALLRDIGRCLKDAGEASVLHLRYGTAVIGRDSPVIRLGEK